MYDNPDRRVYTFPWDAANDGDTTFAIVGPKGKAGRLQDYGIQAVQTQFTADSTEATIEVGDSGDADEFGEALGLGTVNANEAKMVRTESADHETVEENHIVDEDIPADTTVLVKATAPTGGTPAGEGYVQVVIDWAN